MKQRRNQSEDNRVLKQLSSGYTLYNQSGQKFYLPNQKNSNTIAEQDIERQLLIQQNVIQGGQIRLASKNKTMDVNKANIGVGTVQVLNSDKLTHNHQYQSTEKNRKTGTSTISILTQPPVYRIAHPYSNTVDMNAKLWQSSNKATKGLLKIPTQEQKKSSTQIYQSNQPQYDYLFENEILQNKKSLPREDPPVFNEAAQLLNQKAQLQSSLDHSSKPFQFLSSIGGKMLINDDLSQISQIAPVKRERPQTVSTTTKLDFQIIEHRNLKSAQQSNTTGVRRIKAHTKSSQFQERPMTTKTQRKEDPIITVKKFGGTVRQAYRIKSANVDFQKMDQQSIEPQPQMQRPKSSWAQSRPLSAKTALPEQFFQTYTKYTNFSALDLPYEELFDRNERTIAATFAKFGDLGYYSPIQRIGSYIQFSAKLKKEHLLEIVDLQQTMTNVEKEDQGIPIQLGIINELNPYQLKQKTGINSGSEDANQNREPVTLSLFPEYFEDEDESLTPQQMSQKYFQNMLDEMGGNYEPSKLAKSQYIYIGEEFWPDSIRKRVETSITRYNHYIFSDLIKPNEIPKYKKEWMVNAFNLISERLLQNEECSRVVFQEIFETFKISMKKAMLDYILRSPEERKRLHITLLPREFLASSQRIAREGGFNLLLFSPWHRSVETAKEFCQLNLINISKTTSALQDWFQEFRFIRLAELATIKQVSLLGYTFTIPEFIRIQTIYRLNVVCLLQHIWHRGALAIIKKSKYLRQGKKSIWTFVGPKEEQLYSETKPRVVKVPHFTDGIVEEEENEEDIEPEEQPPQVVVQEEELEEDEIDDDDILYNDSDPLIYNENGPNFISVKRALQFIEHRLNLKNSAPSTSFKDSCHALSAYLEFLIFLQNPDPKDPNELSSQELQQIPSDELHIAFSSMDKEQRKKILDNTAFLMKLQLRKVIEETLYYLQNQFLSVKDFRTWINSKKIDLKQPTPLQSYPSLLNYKDHVFSYEQPPFLKYCVNFKPFIRIDMILENDLLRFKEQEDNVKQEFIEFIRSIVTSFDKFLHPKFCKVSEDKQFSAQRFMRQMQFNFDPEMGGLTKEDFEKFYKSFWPQIRISEKQPKEHPELLLASVGLQQNSENEAKKETKETRRFLAVANLNTETEFGTIENRIISHILRHYEECTMTFQLFDQFNLFIDKSVEREIKQIIAKKGGISNEEFKGYMEILQKFLLLLEKVPKSANLPLFEINCEPVIKQLKNTITDYKDRIFNRFETSLIDAARLISDRYVQISNYIRRSLKTPDDVEAMEKYIADLTGERVQLKQRTSEIFQKLVFVFKQNFTVSESLLALSEELYNRPNSLDKELIEQEEKHQIERQRLERSLKERREMFENKVDVYIDDMQNFENFTEKPKYKNYIQEIEEFEEALAAADKEMKEIIDQESKLFGYASNFENFTNLQQSIQPFSELWKAIGVFMDAKKRWMMNPIVELDSSEVETIIKNQLKVSQKLVRTFKPNSIALRVSNEFREDVQQMNSHLPAIEVLSNPGLRDRHWDDIQSVMNIKFNFKEGTLRELLNKGVETYLIRIEEISENASKEFSLENALNKMEKEWENLKLVIINYKNRNVLILQGAAVEEIQIVLDEHTIKAQTIRTNPSIKFMEERAIKWEKLMLYLQEVLDLWIKVQTMYLYLEPIFSFDDINKTLYEESEKFQKVALNWNMIMQRVESDPLVKNLEKIPDLLITLRQSIKWIDEIQRGLENHLELKRLDFPRFFFLSNDDLINILAETRDPLLVQPHMRKCFEGIDELIFSHSAEILGMKSVEKEEVKFDHPVSPKEYKSNAEKWLLKVEEEMRNTLQHMISDCFTDLNSYIAARKPRQEWLGRWPAQCIIACSSLHFTASVEQCLETNGPLTSYEHLRQQQLQEIVSLVRNSSSYIERMMFSALIVLEVHNNDVLTEIMNNGVKVATDFIWLSQLRYYMPGDSAQVSIKMVYAKLRYMYEYLGVGTRLVVTPLTDRCYRTLVGALQLNLGGAPEGPAGTGKTESTKDLAKAVAVQCVVFNCGEGLNAHAMAKFFKGLASGGAWSCFDEFNRIDLEVLSVIAQQILQIQQAKSQGKNRFVFEGTDIALQLSCNIFITMNPGYAGRSELPDNLRALFRPCAMMVPDYALIAEISLYSYGFIEARTLARKIVAVYKLCSEQLSSQDHYDYGMRAVKSVLTAAQSLKRRQPNEKEDILILRAICDINLPKFLTQDVQLFNGILSDLFPGLKPPPVEYRALNEAMTQVLNKNNLQGVQNFRKKVLQLYEMINCRHGLMLVGHTLSGKSSCYKVLAGTLTNCSKNENTDEKPVQYHIINPKSVTLAQLYGFSDPVSKEWTEGILAEIYRKCATSTLPDRQFIVFDGPVDAEWIENMNTVLDDNKKLCLMNGETIAMSDRMTIMFEVQDLMQASPATVSRCGMVYLSPDQLGWNAIFLTNFSSFRNDLELFVQDRLENLFDIVLEKCIHFVQSKCVQYEKVPEAAFVISLLKFLKSFLKDYGYLDKSDTPVSRQEEITIKLDALFIYSVMWTVGGSVDEPGRKLFDQYFKKMLREPLKSETKADKLIKFDKQSQIPELSNTQCYDFYYEFRESRWRNWKDQLGSQIISPNANFNSITIETSESLRITSLLTQSIKHAFPFMLIGPSGVGKTVYVRKYLQNLPFTKYLMLFVGFSATSSAMKTQQIIDSKLDRRRKGIFGPPLGVEGLIYIDDLNMPKPDKYGAQPPLELLRQYFDQGGWFGSDRTFMQLISLTILTTMSPPGGSRSAITQRLLRHFNIATIVQPDIANMQRIYNTIIEWHLQKIGAYNSEIKQNFENCIDSIIEIYMQLKEQMKPTPRKSWYFMNMRDISRCVQGMLLLTNSVELLKDPRKSQRLWLHEVSRTFYDRLAQGEGDQDKFWGILSNTIRIKLRDDLKIMMKHYEDESNTKLILSNPNFLQNYNFSDILGEELGPSDRQYVEITSIKRVYVKLEFYLDEMNQNSKRPMPLALFDYAVQHLIRINRILRIQEGQGLLIGLGGSGRQSLTRLACYIREVDLVQVEVSKGYNYDQWKEDMQKLVVNAGVEGKESCFLITEAQLKKEFIMEDVNSLLNTGDIPNLFSTEEFVPLIDKLRTWAKKEGFVELVENGTNLQYYEYFVKSAKRKLHIIVGMSPIGDTLRNNIRMFPSIVNCCTINCFHEWPEEALEAVAKKLLVDCNLDIGIQKAVVAQCKFMHESMSGLSKSYFSTEGRYTYVTPSSYFELLKTFTTLLSLEKQKLEDLVNLYTTGVQKLDYTQEHIKIMEEELRDKQPLLIQMTEETQKIADTIQQQALAMEPKKQQAVEEEAMVNERVQEAQIIKDDCEKDLSVAKPKLKKAEEALDTIDPNDINSIKAMLKPPDTVQLVMEAVCVLCGVPAIPIPNPKNPKERIQSYWEASKKFLSEKDFLQRLIYYDKENIKPEIMQKIRDRYISNTAVFNVKRVEKASSAAKGLCEWILALDEFEKVLTVVRPKQQKYYQSKAEVDRLEASLRKTREELDALNREIERLKDLYDSTKQKLEKLNQEVIDCEKKLQRASQLMTGLGGERERWGISAKKFEQRLKFVLGDILLASGVIGYLGVFSANFRQRAIKLWTENIKSNFTSLHFNSNFSLENILANAMQVRKWRMNGLPSDPFSTDNGIIISRSLRWSLLLDPQGQGNRFVKNNEVSDETKSLKLVKPTDADFLRCVENAIQFGQSLVIENVTEEVDSVLDGVLLKQTFKNAGILSVKLGDNIVEYNKKFQLFLTSKLRNPHYTPDISTKVNLVNFSITQGGLEDQLLELCVMKEKPDLEEQKNKLILQSHINQQELQRVEDRILSVLNKADNILDDEKGIEALQQSKDVANDIEEKQKVADFTERKIDEARVGYKPIAVHSALLFFAVIALSPLDPMYQYSLSWFLQLYQEAFDKSEQSNFLKQRIENVNTMVMQMVFGQVSRGLFEKDKLLFSFLIQIKIMEQKKHLDYNEFAFIVQPIQIDDENIENPFKEWLPQLNWLRIQALMKLQRKFVNLPDSFAQNEQAWRSILMEGNAHQLKFPEPFVSATPIQRMCILKALRPDKLTRAIYDFVFSDLGERYVNPPSFSIKNSFVGSHFSTPLLFILPGADPMNALISFAESKTIQLKAVSLGQGQGVVAEKAIEEAKQSGHWVILQNCHLAASWMPKLDRICEELQRSKVQPAFRLWLSSYPSNDLPPQVVQTSIKMTNEPPSGIKTNILTSYQSSTIQQISFEQQPKQMLQLIYSLCFFHAIVQERRSYGALGFNVRYDFNQSDLQISVRQLQLLVQGSGGGMADFYALHYLVGECNYGGRVTDERDRRVIKALLREYMSEAVLSETFKFGGVKEFASPVAENYETYLKHIEAMSSDQPSQLFGFHTNAEIVKDLNNTEDFLTKLQLVSVVLISNKQQQSEEGKQQQQQQQQQQQLQSSSDNLLKQLTTDLLNKFPKRFDLEIAQAKFPVDYKNSINTVFLQEIMRYNKLLIVISQSLKDVDAALKGLVAMSDNLEKITRSMTSGLVPEQWLKFSYPSLKPLGSYMNDLFKRIKHFTNWLDRGSPRVHWISGFFFTQSFLTATLQNYARKYQIAIDQLNFDFEFFEMPNEELEFNRVIGGQNSNYTYQIDGNLIQGLYFEGCRWDFGKEVLVESDPKILYTLAPIIWLKPLQMENQVEEDELSQKKYRCPVYKTAERRGVLSTTGHSTNFIMSINLPSIQDASHWVKRGVALLCQLSD